MDYRRIRMTWGLLALVCATTVMGIGTAAAEDKRLFIYNWSDFIGPETIVKFEKLTGIKVTYDIYDAEETMEARLMAGSSGYDVVSASTDFFSREIKAGVYAPWTNPSCPTGRIWTRESSLSRPPTIRATITPYRICIPSTALHTTST
jgi:spermidine/putrescine-binding protein